jgi:hypothetical protein
MSYEGPGSYRHYKGGEYQVLGLSVPEADSDQRGFDPSDPERMYVVYMPLTPGSLLDPPEAADYESVPGEMGRGHRPRFMKLPEE